MRLVGNWIESFMILTRNTEAAYMYRKWTAISIIASVLQRKCYLDWGTLTFYPNMYIVLIGPPGCRKGTAADFGEMFLGEMRINMAAEAITREALIRELGSATDTVIDMKTGTMEFHSSLTVYSKELTVFLGYQNHQMMSDLCDWYDCRRKWTYRTKGAGTDEIINVWVNLFGATTPELIQSALPLNAIGGGLASRIIFVFEVGKGCTIICPFLTPADEELKTRMIHDLHIIKQLHGRWTVTEDFLKFWTEWYPAQDNNPPFDDTRFAGYFERRPTHVMKLSLIQNAARTDSRIIDRCDGEAAVNLLIDTEVNMPNTFSGMGKAPNADTMARIMAYIGNKKTVSYAELLKVFIHDIDKRMLDNIIQTLEAINFCEFVVNTGIINYKK